MTGRALAYPISTVIVPVAWWLVARRRGRRPEYPYVLDILVVLPFLIDTVGNALDLYDSIDWWDDLALNHLVNWAILVAAFGQLLLRLRVCAVAADRPGRRLRRRDGDPVELAEYFTFIRSNPDEYRTAYTDTLGDLTLGLTGSVVAALFTVWLARRRSAVDEPSHVDCPRTMTPPREPNPVPGTASGRPQAAALTGGARLARAGATSREVACDVPGARGSSSKGEHRAQRRGAPFEWSRYTTREARPAAAVASMLLEREPPQRPPPLRHARSKSERSRH